MRILIEIKELFVIFYAYTGRRMYIVFGLTMLAVIVESLGIAMLLPLIQIIDTGGFSGDSDSTINQALFEVLAFFRIDDSAVLLLVFIGIIFCIKAGVTFAHGAYSTILTTNLRREMTSKLYQLYGNMEYSYYARHNTGHFINVLIQQVYRLISGFFTFKGFLAKIIQTFFYLAFATLISWKFALMAFVAGIIYILVFSQLNDYVKKLSRQTSEEYSTLNKQLVQNLHGFKYLSATALFGRLTSSVTDTIHKLTGYGRSLGILSTFVGALKEPLSILLLLSIIIIQISVFEEPIAPIFVSLILVNRAMGKMMALQGSWLGTISLTGAIEMVEKEMKDVGEAQEQNGGIEMKEFSDNITLENISLWYTNKPEKGEKAGLKSTESQNSSQPPVISGLSLTIPARHTIAVTGPSGGGKTSLLDVIMLLLTPQNGRVLIDGIDAKELNKASWRRQIGFVAQDLVVFDDTIGQNICLWEGDYNSDADLYFRIEEACEQAFLKEFIASLPEGLNTKVGDRGVKLSGGQKQRLFIARELFKQPKVLILDEATSALDQESERFIQKSIERVKGDMTVIIVAHRLSTIKTADCIYVLDNGRISEFGTYDELISRKGRLAELAGPEM